MRWRFVDRVTAFEPWQQIAGRKAVSLEEYHLLQPLGREGVFPESLMIECCTELVRWLVAASSSFTQATVLAAIEEFAFDCPARMGCLLDLKARVTARDEGGITAECLVGSDGMMAASGRLGLTVFRLDEGLDPGELEGLWRELYGSA